MDKFQKMLRKEACFVLGVREDASIEDIKRAYRYKVKLYHPDENPQTDTKEHYIKIQKAYEYLINNVIGACKSENMEYGNNSIYNSAINNVYSNNTFMHGFNYNNQQMCNNGYFYSNGMNYVQQNVFFNNMAQQRPAKIFSTDDKVRTEYVKQKEKESERKKVKKWEEENNNLKKSQDDRFNSTNGKKDLSGINRKSKEQEIIERIKAIWLAENIKRQIELDRQKKEHNQQKKLYQAFMQQKMNEEE